MLFTKEVVDLRGHLRQRSRGSWTLVLELGRDASGRRRQKWLTVRGSKRDAERELARLNHELNTGSYVEASTMTVAEYLAYWLDGSAKARVAGKTFERYSEIVQLHLAPAF